MRKRALLALGAVAAVAAIGGGLYLLVAKDRAVCEAKFGRIEVERVFYDTTAEEWQVEVGGVVNLGARMDSWKATYGGKVFSSTDAEGVEASVSQFERKARRAGFLGSDVKKLYGASYKHYTFPFYIVAPEAGGGKVTLEGVIKEDGSTAEHPFKHEVSIE